MKAHRGRRSLSLAGRLVPLVLASLSLALAGCQETAEDAGEAGGGGEPAGVSEGVQALPADAPFLSAPESLVVQGLTLEIETYLWRDFMPISPPGGKPLIASVTVQDAGGGELPGALELSEIRVVYGDSLWIAPMDTTAADESHSPTRHRRVARGGPQWGPGVDVDVYVKLYDGGEEIGWLAARDQPIQRTD